MTSYYCTTCFYQNDIEFRCSWDLSATKGEPTSEETINHLAAMLDENYPETWNLLEEDEEDDEEQDQEDSALTTLNLYGLSPQEFAQELVLHEKRAEERYGVTWVVSTNWEEADPDYWEHPCNL